MNEDSITELITDEAHSIPRLSQVEVPLIDNEPGITVYGHDTLFHARLRPVFRDGGWVPGGLGEDPTRVVVRRLAKESSDEDVNQEVRHSLKYYYPYVMQLFGASRIASLNKFLVYSNANVTTYIDFKGSKRGEDYRSYDSQYDTSFNSAWRYLKNEVPVDGFTLDVIFSETRTVNANGGSALIVVPALPSSPVDRAKLITKVLEEFQYKVNRRIDVANRAQFTRCPECLPSTGGWNLGLINSVLRCLENVEPHLEWGKFLIQSRSEEADEERDQDRRGRDEFNNAFEKAQKLAETLSKNTETGLNRAMNDVIMRSNLATSGICSWCAKKWERKEGQLFQTFEDSTAVITIVEEMPENLEGKRSSSFGCLEKLTNKPSYRLRIVMVVICLLLAGVLAFMKRGAGS
ncbi:uncharacterized protein C8R40DRAFT_1069294 [Lentinula edodes]|uniref:uncharacterized protein n=1 Tax=Lentinula edodes TaxID=5353 RepID=UPI001E8D1353|nr:uncharacterized protein C8R40DRAFT_1069294 [Lentinula edodes]KAH7875713.1 hypothetical protein C8R40DRAFT_1069294 [Lentinula edodes]